MMAIILRMSAFLLVALAIEYYWISRGMTSILNMIFTEYKQSGRLTWDNFKRIIILIVSHIIVILIGLVVAILFGVEEGNLMLEQFVAMDAFSWYLVVFVGLVLFMQLVYLSQSLLRAVHRRQLGIVGFVFWCIPLIFLAFCQLVMTMLIIKGAPL